jgi:hypothetical protein
MNVESAITIVSLFNNIRIPVRISIAPKARTLPVKMLSTSNWGRFTRTAN